MRAPPLRRTGPATSRAWQHRPADAVKGQTSTGTLPEAVGRGSAARTEACPDSLLRDLRNTPTNRGQTSMHHDRHLRLTAWASGRSRLRRYLGPARRISASGPADLAPDPWAVVALRPRPVSRTGTKCAAAVAPLVADGGGTAAACKPQNLYADFIKMAPSPSRIFMRIRRSMRSDLLEAQ